MPTGQRSIVEAAGSDAGPARASRSACGGQSGRPHETARQPKTSAWRSNRRDRSPKTTRKYAPTHPRAAAPCASCTVVGSVLPGEQARAGPEVGRDRLGHQGHDGQAPQEEEAEIREVPVGDVADLVAEDRLHLALVQQLDQSVGQQDVAEPGQSPRDARVDHVAAGVPDEDVGAAETGSVRRAAPSRSRRGPGGKGRVGQVSRTSAGASSRVVAPSAAMSATCTQGSRSASGQARCSRSCPTPKRIATGRTRPNACRASVRGSGASPVLARDGRRARSAGYRPHQHAKADSRKGTRTNASSRRIGSPRPKIARTALGQAASWIVRAKASRIRPSSRRTIQP